MGIRLASDSFEGWRHRLYFRNNPESHCKTRPVGAPATTATTTDWRTLWLVTVRKTSTQATADTPALHQEGKDHPGIRLLLQLLQRNWNTSQQCIQKSYMATSFQGSTSYFWPSVISLAEAKWSVEILVARESGDVLSSIPASPAEAVREGALEGCWVGSVFSIGHSPPLSSSTSIPTLLSILFFFFPTFHS